MGLEGLTQIDIIHGSFSLIFTIVSIIIGLKISLKYISVKKIELFTVGMSWVLLSSAYWGSAISFVTYILYSFTLNLFWYLFVNNVFLPVALMFWIYSFCKLVYPNKLKITVIIYFLICIPYEIILVILLMIDPKIIGSMDGIFNSSNKIFVMVFLIFSIITVLITGFLFSRKSLKSDDPRTRWKGRFLLSAFIAFVIGGTLDMGLPIDPVILVLVRLFLISSSFLFYFGFFLPNFVARLLIKGK